MSCVMWVVLAHLGQFHLHKDTQEPGHFSPHSVILSAQYLMVQITLGIDAVLYGYCDLNLKNAVLFGLLIVSRLEA